MAQDDLTPGDNPLTRTMLHLNFLWRTRKKAIVAAALFFFAYVIHPIYGRIVDWFFDSSTASSPTPHSEIAGNSQTDSNYKSNINRESKLTEEPEFDHEKWFLVTDIQMELRRLRVYDGEIDGLAGDGTWNGISELKDRGVPQALTQDTLSALRSLNDKPVISDLENLLIISSRSAVPPTASAGTPPPIDWLIFQEGMRNTPSNWQRVRDAIIQLPQLSSPLSCEIYSDYLEGFYRKNHEQDHRIPTAERIANYNKALTFTSPYVDTASDRRCISILAARASDSHAQRVLFSSRNLDASTTFVARRKSHAKVLDENFLSLVERITSAPLIFIDPDLYADASVLIYLTSAVLDPSSDPPAALVPPSFSPNWRRNLIAHLEGWRKRALDFANSRQTD